MQTSATQPRKIPKTDQSLAWRLRSLPVKPTNVKLAEIKKAVRAIFDQRAAKAAK